MTLPRVVALMDYWEDWPPLHTIVTPLLTFMGCTPAGGRTAAPAPINNDGLLAEFGGAGIVPG